MSTLKSKLLHTDNNSYTEWMHILNQRFDLQPLLHAIKFDAFKNASRVIKLTKCDAIKLEGGTTIKTYEVGKYLNQGNNY